MREVQIVMIQLQIRYKSIKRKPLSWLFRKFLIPLH